MNYWPVRTLNLEGISNVLLQGSGQKVPSGGACELTSGDESSKSRTNLSHLQDWKFLHVGSPN